jgi:predicted NAD/FAD-dependent oxidoreductase
MEVLVIGAGIAGLSCARQLNAHGHLVTVVDKGRGVGGRLATRRLGESAYDTGAQFITARDAEFAAELHAAGARVWSHGFPRLGGEEAADGHPRYVMPGGMNRLAKWMVQGKAQGKAQGMAQGLTLRDQLTVTGLAVVDGRVQVTCTPGDLAPAGAVARGPAQVLSADAVVLTAPAPQAAQLLSGQGFTVPPEVLAVRYDPCLCLLLDYPQVGAALMPLPGGVQVADDAAIGWIASQRAKGFERVGDGLIVHATGAWSAAHYGLAEAAIVELLRPRAEVVLRRLGITAEAADCQLKKWKFSLPTITVAAPCVRVAATAPVLLAGDAFGGRPRVEGAWLSGRAAAAAILSGS